MWMFDWFRDQFNQGASWCSDIARRARNIPLLGNYFAYPFDSLYYVFANLRTAAQHASYWSDQITSTASAAYSNVLTVWNYAYGYLSSAVQNALNTANSAYNYARNTVWNLANLALTTAQNAWQYAAVTLPSMITAATSTIWTQINNLTSWKDSFVSLFWSQINNLDAWKNELLTKILTVRDIRDLIDAQTGATVTAAIALVTASASSFADPLWQCADAIVGKLTEWRR